MSISFTKKHLIRTHHILVARNISYDHNSFTRKSSEDAKQQKKLHKIKKRRKIKVASQMHKLKYRSIVPSKIFHRISY